MSLIYLGGLLATLLVGIVTGVWFARRDEAERLDIALTLRSIGEARRCPDHVRVPTMDANDSDVQQWEQVADTCGFPIHDYQRRETP